MAHSIFHKIEINRRDRLYKNVLKKQGKGADEATQSAIACILDHDECFDAFAAGIELEFSNRPEPFWGFGFGNVLTDLLSWIMDNWDQILEMILTIIDLFSSNIEFAKYAGLEQAVSAHRAKVAARGDQQNALAV